MSATKVVYDERFRELIIAGHGGCAAVVNWSQMKSLLDHAVKLHDNEHIVGLKVDKDGIKCYLETDDDESTQNSTDLETRRVQTEPS